MRPARRHRSRCPLRGRTPRQLLAHAACPAPAVVPRSRVAFHEGDLSRGDPRGRRARLGGHHGHQRIAVVPGTSPRTVAYPSFGIVGVRGARLCRGYVCQGRRLPAARRRARRAIPRDRRADALDTFLATRRSGAADAAPLARLRQSRSSATFVQAVMRRVLGWAASRVFVARASRWPASRGSSCWCCRRRSRKSHRGLGGLQHRRHRGPLQSARCNRRRSCSVRATSSTSMSWAPRSSSAQIVPRFSSPAPPPAMSSRGARTPGLLWSRSSAAELCRLAIPASTAGSSLPPVAPPGVTTSRAALSFSRPALT